MGLEGSIRTNSYEKDGKTIYKTVVKSQRNELINN
ncbi:MAG TPA: hypothetical protein GX708_17865 [Gallicola sp.]|nr:hypothetical protein [Gallicola sp.]